ncbi:MAG TPA: TonB-dependent receptor [Vicinamibacterales bacterium]|nr:TonB-dependent receptor [Vicinamibacterales bacterium]
MTGATSFVASAAVGGLLVVATPALAPAQPGAARAAAAPVVRLTPASAPGSLSGVVRDERGLPIANVVVSALGAVTTLAITDSTGRFEFGTLTPGPYLLRAHLAGYVAPRAQMVQVRTSARAVSAIALRREGAAPVLIAGLGLSELGAASAAPEPESTGTSGRSAERAEPANTDSDDTDDHSETAWRIRHARRGVLKDVTIPEELLASAGDDHGLTRDVFGQLAGTPGRFVSLFAEAPISGQVNFLTSGSFDTPQQLFSPDAVARNIANVRLGAPAGDHADWAVAGALTQADISSWVVAGSYSMRAPARHRYDVGLSYSTQRYDGGNPLALRDVTDGSRNVGTVYGYDSFVLSPDATLTFGTEYARYDYLANRSLLSPRVELTLSPGANTRVTAAASQRSLAPGAEEFLPPADSGIWLPPQRTFSSFAPHAAFQAERTRTASLGLEQDLGPSTLAVRAFRQHVNDQLVTVFGGDLPGRPTAKVGHYLVGNTGDVDASGFSAEFRAVIASRVHGSVQYSVARAQILQAGNDYVMLLAPLAARPGTSTVQDMTARVETEVPETSTRVMLLYRLSNGFAQPGSRGESATRRALDGRFDVQVRQSLPFMNFSNARWEMLLAVRNFFRDASCEQSLYDELFVIRPPKRVVGGVTLHF